MDWNATPDVKISISLGKDDDVLDRSDLVIFCTHDIQQECVDTGIADQLDSSFVGRSGNTWKKSHDKISKSLTIRRIKENPVKRFILLKIDESKIADESKCPLGFKIGSMVAQSCIKESGATSCKCALLLPSNMIDNTTFVSNFTVGLYDGLYSDNRFRTNERIKVHAKNIDNIILCNIDGNTNNLNKDNFIKAVKKGKNISKGLYLTKDIVNAPHCVMNSVEMANVASKIAEEYSHCMTCLILDHEECERRSMGAFLGVARGSEIPPKFIHLIYRHEENGNDNDVNIRRLGFVGKGITFDTGGYDIKTSLMSSMKADCGGAAAVLGASVGIALLQPRGVEIHFIVAACDNMMNHKAYVPSDILTSSNGTTIEVVNTDAEGRLTLSDALVYADKEVKCEYIIELSTLTGSCTVALGKKIGGMWTKDDTLAKELEFVSTATNDKCWRMPLIEEYNALLSSQIADLKNYGPKSGGPITAALFLHHFVERAKFAHIDFAGPVCCDESGATGFGVKLIIEWIIMQAQKEK